MASLTKVETRVYRYPLHTPVVTSFGAMSDRPAVLVRVEDSDGAHGWGEIWCNFPQCGAEHRARLVDNVIAPLLLGRASAAPAETFRGLEARLRVLAIQTAEFGPLAQTLAGVDIALWDLAARRAAVPLRRLLDPAARETVPAYASGIHPDGLEEAVVRERESGYRAYKLKVGFGRERDVAATRRLRELLREDERLMLDANQAWDAATAADMASRLAEYEPGWLEEPVAADTPWADWRALAARCVVGLAAGENLRGEEAFDAAIASEALRVVQPDLCKWGGYSGCLPVARRVLAAGLTYCPHYLGAGLGLVASGQLLAAAGGSGLLEVDSNPNPLRELLAEPFPRVEDGRMTLPQGAGLGVEPNLPEAQRWLAFSTCAS